MGVQRDWLTWWHFSLQDSILTCPILPTAKHTDTACASWKRALWFKADQHLSSEHQQAHEMFPSYVHFAGMLLLPESKGEW